MIPLQKLFTMQKVSLLFLLLFACLSLQAGNSEGKVYQGFSGGMMVHTGYLFGKDRLSPLDKELQGATFGIGGAVRVHLWKHLRIGSEGFTSTMNASTTNYRSTLQSGSYIRTGWGGVLADACWRLEKVWPYVGGTIGGGAMRSLYILEGDENDWEEERHTLFHKQSFFYISPYAGIDWCITQKVHLTFRLDWMVAWHKQAVVQPTGPRCYIGFMFSH